MKLLKLCETCALRLSLKKSNNKLGFVPVVFFNDPFHNGMYNSVAVPIEQGENHEENSGSVCCSTMVLVLSDTTQGTHYGSGLYVTVVYYVSIYSIL